MPDLVTHVSLPYILAKLLRINKYMSIFLLGSILPDILSRPFTIISESPEVLWLTEISHCPLPIVLFCYLITLLFQKDIRRWIFLSLLSGSIFHIFLDSFQAHVSGGGIRWLFPFSFKKYGFDLFWPEDSLYIMPVFVAVALILVIVQGSPRPFIKPFNKKSER